MALIVRKRRDGTVTLDGDAPKKHQLAGSFINRELEDKKSDLVEVFVVLHFAGQPATYRLKNFDQEEREDDDGNKSLAPNLSAWNLELVEAKEVKA